MRSYKKLTATEVANLKKTGRYGDGDGLYLQISRWHTKSWVLRFMVNGQARTMGLGSIRDFTLKEARERAREVRQQIADGIDPIAAKLERKAHAAAKAAKTISFADAARKYIAAHRPSWKSPKHAGQWEATLANYAYPVFGDLPVDQIDTGLVMKALEPIWLEKTETASRLRGRIERILGWATVRGYRSGDNPARWKGHLDMLLPAKTKVAKVRHQPALPYMEMPAFMQELRAADGISAKALEFTILTAARTGEVIGAKWNEIDIEEKVWMIPGSRMKSGREHRVALSDRAVEVLNSIPRVDGCPFIFPGSRHGKGLSNMAMLEQLRGMRAGLTVHGFRSSFRDWAAEQTNYPREVAEAALAHVLADKTESAYQRGDLLEKRRKMMAAWAKFAAMPAKGDVVPFRKV